MAEMIYVDVNGRIAQLSDIKQCIVCDNTDYVVNFSLSDEWQPYTNKTVRFRYGDKVTDTVFSGNMVAIPRISDADICEIGLFAGDLYTTTCAILCCKRSILHDDGSPAAPTDDVYNQIMDMLADIEAGQVSEEDIQKAVEKYLEENPIEADGKMDKENPTGTGSFSLNRLENTEVGECSSTFGNQCQATGRWSDAGGYNTTASGNASRACGYNTTASGNFSLAEGTGTEATENNAHAEGDSTQATANSTHAEGYKTKATKNMAHAEGAYSEANGLYSHAEGYRTYANSSYQHVEGKWNIADSAAQYLHIIGNGTSESNRSNAHTLGQDGAAWFSGDVYVGSESGKNKDSGSKKLATTDEVEEIVANSGVIKSTDETLTYSEGLLSVNTSNDVNDNNTLPITSAAVMATVGNIEILLGTI